MNENEMNQVDTELEHAGEDTALSPKMLKLEEMRITPEKELKPMEFLFHLYGKPCFPRKELVAVTGKAKSGKTYMTSMLMACCVTQKVLALERHAEGKGHTGMNPLRVLWYDTEQSDESTQDILKNRVFRMVNPAPDLFSQRNDELFDVFNVRAVAWKERRSLLKEAVSHYDPDLVIVDGIRDLVNDINDGVLAQEVLEELMHLATKKNCCIVCVLHQNKGSEDHNLRGWIGTELMNKAFEVYACEKLMPQRIFKVEQTLTRKYDIEQTLFFEVDPNGLPRLTAVPVEDIGEGDGKERLQPLNRKYIITEDDGNWHFDTQRLFLDVFSGREELSGSELRNLVMQLSGISVPFVYNRVLKEAVDGGHVIRSTKGHLTVYHPAPF